MLDESTFHQNYLMHPRQFVTIIMEQFAEIKKHSNKEKNPESRIALLYVTSISF